MNSVARSTTRFWTALGVIACLFAIAGIVIAVRSYLLRNEFLGVVPDADETAGTAQYPQAVEDPVLFPGVDGQELPVFDVTDFSQPPLSLNLAARSITEPIVFEGEVRHDDSRFLGAMVRLFIETPRFNSRTNQHEWVAARISLESTRKTDGRFPFRIECEPPVEAGQYRLRFEAGYPTPGVKIDPGDPLATMVTAQVAEGMIEFRE